VSVLQNSEAREQIRSQNMPDLRQFLQTGKSPKFAETKILGRWQLDPYATLIQERKRRPDMPARDLIALRRLLTELEAGMTFIATVDQQAILKVALPTPPAPEQAEPTEQDSLAQRYGRPVAPPQQAQPARPAPQAPAIKLPLMAAQGTWEGEGNRYEIRMQTEIGTEQKAYVVADDDRLLVQGAGTTLVFAKAD
jgi:hypothetical protein